MYASVRNNNTEYPERPTCCGVLVAEHGGPGILWRCNHKHRSRNAAKQCATYTLGLGEAAARRVLNRASAEVSKS